MRSVVVIAAGWVAWLVTACSPELNWREVRPGGSGLVTLFPCKPASHARMLPLAGSKVEMSVYACTSAEVTYAIGTAELGGPQAVDAALTELAQAAARNIGSTGALTSRPLRIEGMTPYSRSARLSLVGKLGDGRAVAEEVAVFARGSRVFQATVVGARLEPEAVEAFFGALRLPA